MGTQPLRLGAQGHELLLSWQRLLLPPFGVPSAERLNFSVRNGKGGEPPRYASLVASSPPSVSFKDKEGERTINCKVRLKERFTAFG